MKNRIMKTLFAGFAIFFLFVPSSMLTQDELSEFFKLQNSLIESGVSINEIDSYLGDSDIVTATQMLKEAQATGYFSNNKNSAPSSATTATPAPSATPTPTPKHEHKYSVKLTKDPTCYEEGTLTYTEVIEAKGHMDGQFTITKEPTCTEPGEKTVYCKVCNEEIRTESIDPTGHENTDTRLTPSGLFSAGKEEIYCLKCMKVLETRVIPVPVWHYVVFGIGVTIILIILIAVWIGRIAHKK